MLHTILASIAHGAIALPWWGYLLIAAVSVHLTVIGVTLYYHRDQAHRALDLHPILRELFRFWVWFTTAMVVHEWVAVHRKHHAFVETEDDPHSPQVLGYHYLLGHGAEVYKRARNDSSIVENYRHGTPDDWLERQVYGRFPHLGVVVLLIVEAILFGAPGVAIWAVQMLAMPLLASALINGAGHHSGYRNFEVPDASTNVVPIGLIAGGEELHNNHHAFPSSAKFSVRRFEFDIGWAYIRVLSALRLARVRRTYPRPSFVPRATRFDLEAMRAVVTNRLHVLRAYRREVLMPLLRKEQGKMKGFSLRRLRYVLVRDSRFLDRTALRDRQRLMERFPQVHTVWQYRENLRAIWEDRAASNERVLESLRAWCHEAEQSGIHGLEQFAARLRTWRLGSTTTA